MRRTNRSTNPPRWRIFVELATLIFMVGTLSLLINGAIERDYDGRDFVCLDDDMLVEHHVGVDRVNLDGNTWTLRYIDGALAYYHQPAGETCSLRDDSPYGAIDETAAEGDL